MLWIVACIFSSKYFSSVNICLHIPCMQTIDKYAVVKIKINSTKHQYFGSVISMNFATQLTYTVQSHGPFDVMHHMT